VVGFSFLYNPQSKLYNPQSKLYNPPYQRFYFSFRCGVGVRFDPGLKTSGVFLWVLLSKI